jgi:hypothetical protein
MSGSQWGDHELVRSVHIPVDHSADDELASFDSKEEMVVAASQWQPWIGWLAGLERPKAHWLMRCHEANTKRGAADVEEGTQCVAD